LIGSPHFDPAIEDIENGFDGTGGVIIAQDQVAGREVGFGTWFCGWTRALGWGGCAGRSFHGTRRGWVLIRCQARCWSRRGLGRGGTVGIATILGKPEG
jgi:hypothetical protein